MTTTPTSSSPPSVELTELFTMSYDLHPHVDHVGATGFGQRILFTQTGGTFHGERLSGTVEPGGSDWVLIGDDAVADIDADLILRTRDDATIHAHWRGRIVPTDELRPALLDLEQRAQIDPHSYLFGITPTFETGHRDYQWLNDVVAIGRCRFTPTGLAYTICHLTPTGSR